jgi:hypothetical protein
MPDVVTGTHAVMRPTQLAFWPLRFWGKNLATMIDLW